MEFKKWFEITEQNDIFQHLTPLEKIGSGHFASVYATENPNIVIRIEPLEAVSSCEKIMLQPKLQATNGVAKIYGHSIKTGQELFPNDVSQKNRKFSVTIKEKVDTKWFETLANKYEKQLRKIYPIEKTMKLFPYGKKAWQQYGLIPAFIQLALEQFRQKESIKEFLSIFGKHSEGLIAALDNGLPFDDLHSGNLGLNTEGNLVVIDC